MTIRLMLYPIFILFVLFVSNISIYPFRNISINTKPTNTKLAKQLTKSIANQSLCRNVKPTIINKIKQSSKFRSFSCEIVDSTFYIYTFASMDTKNKMLNTVKSDNLINKRYGTCFKTGLYYILCAKPSTNSLKNGKKFYYLFPGKTIY